ncbi:TPA: hypothetical protein ACGBG5_003346 [Enterococcus faecalis]
MKKQLIGGGISLVMGLTLVFTQKAVEAEMVETGQVVVTYQVEETSSEPDTTGIKEEPAINPPTTMGKEKLPTKPVKEPSVSEQPQKTASSQGAEPTKRLAGPPYATGETKKEALARVFPSTNEKKSMLGNLLGTFLIIFVGILYRKKDPKKERKAEIEQ